MCHHCSPGAGAQAALPVGPVSQCQFLGTCLAVAPLSTSSGAGALSKAAWGLSEYRPARRGVMAAAASWCCGRSRSDVWEGTVGTGVEPPQQWWDVPRFAVTRSAPAARGCAEAVPRHWTESGQAVPVRPRGRNQRLTFPPADWRPSWRGFHPCPPVSLSTRRTRRRVSGRVAAPLAVAAQLPAHAFAVAAAIGRCRLMGPQPGSPRKDCISLIPYRHLVRTQ